MTILITLKKTRNAIRIFGANGWLCYWGMVLVSLLENIGGKFSYIVFTKNALNNIQVQDYVSLKKDMLIFLPIIFVIIVILKPLLKYFVTNKITNEMKKLKLKLIRNILYNYDEKKITTGDMLLRLNRNINDFYLLFRNNLVSLSSLIISCIGSIILLCQIDVKVSLIPIFWGLCSILLTPFFIKNYSNRWNEINTLQSTQTQMVNDIISSMPFFLLIQNRNIILEKFKSLVDRSVSEEKIALKSVSISGLILTLSANLGVFSTIFVSVFMLKMNAGEILAVIVLCQTVQMFFNRIPKVIMELQSFLISIDRIIEIFDLQKTQYKIIPSNINSFVKLNNISFKYENSVIFEDINIDIKKEQKIGIYGANGCGKTTLLKILLGILKPDNGEIIWNSLNFEKAQISNYVSYVSQAPILLDGSISENISCGIDNNLNEKIINAASQAQCSNFIELFKDTYNTHLSRNSSEISTGQRQRLAIARSLYRDTPIMVLDEPTSSISQCDAEALYTVISQLNKTMIIVSHDQTLKAYVDVCYEFYEENNIKSLRIMKRESL